jgi:hypothetical protein
MVRHVGLFDRILGRDREPSDQDRQAIERYRYLLRTAPPEAIEEVHAEAFSKLTPEQRRQVLGELSNEVPEYEGRGASDDPRSLARLATRAEVRQPGTLERTFGNIGGGGGPSFGSMFASSLLGSIAGYVIGSAIADQFFSDHGDAFAADHGDSYAADNTFSSEPFADAGGDIDFTGV